MARPLRINYEGAVYHVTLRGNEQKAIFKDDQDRERYLLKLEESLKRYDVRLYLFCLMTNMFTWFKKLYETLVEGSTPSQQDISFRRPGSHCSVENVLSVLCKFLGIERSALFVRQRDSILRPMAAAALCEHSGLTQREVADVLKLQTGAAVSHQIKRLRECMNKNASLRKKYADMARIIQEQMP